MYSLTFCVRFLLPERYQWKPAVQTAAVMLRTPLRRRPVAGRPAAPASRMWRAVLAAPPSPPGRRGRRGRRGRHFTPFCNGVKFGVEASPNFTIHRRNVLPLRSENSQRYPSSNLNTGVCAKRIKLIMKRPFCRSTDDNDNGRVNQSNLYKRDHTALFFCGAGMFSKVSLSRMPGTVLYQ